MRRRHEEVFRRALELAESGTCGSWLDVQDQLTALGYRRAPDLLDADKLRAIVDSRCRAAAMARKCA